MCVFKFPLPPERDARSTSPPHPSHYLISAASFPLLGLRHTQESLLTLNAQLSKLWCFLHQRRCVSGFFSSCLRCVLNPSTMFFILLPKMHDFHQKEFREQVPVHRQMRKQERVALGVHLWWEIWDFGGTFRFPSCAQSPRRVLCGGQGNGWWERDLGCFEALGVLVTSGAASNYPG